MIVIADTTPLHYLILLNHADILRELYGRVIIPEAVFGELQVDRIPAIVKQWIASCPDWLEVRRASVPQDLALAETLRADAVILDDKAARREAARRNLRVIGTLRVLDDAAVAGLVDLPEALRRLLAAGFYLDPTLVQFLLDRHFQRIRGKATT